MPPKLSSSSQKAKEKVETAQKAGTAHLCPQCSDEVSGDDQGIMCDLCEKWFHIICQDVTEEEYNFFNEYKRNHWFCKTCDKSVMSIIKTVNSLKERQDKVEEEFGKVKEDMKRLVVENQSMKVSTSKISQDIEQIMDGNLTNAMITRIGQEIEKVTKSVTNDLSNVKEDIKKLNSDTEQKIVNTVESKLEEGVKKQSFADIVAQQVDSQLVKVSGDLNKVQQVIDETKKKADEEKDREGRCNNIIIYRIPESSTAEGRVKHDKSFSIELFNEVMELDIKEEELKSVFRLGKWDASNPTNRPLLIQFREKSIKNRVMESLSKLKSASDKFKNLSITHDMTKNERSECKRLVEEAKKKESDDHQGEFIWRVRGLPGQLKLIRFRKH